MKLKKPKYPELADCYNFFDGKTTIEIAGDDFLAEALKATDHAVEDWEAMEPKERGQFIDVYYSQKEAELLG